MGHTRITILILWVAALVAGGFWAYSAQDLLFTSAILWVPFAAFAGILLAGLVHTGAPARITNGKVLRHEPAGTFAEHWTVVIGGLVLIVTGIDLGFLFVPRFAGSAESVVIAMNLHFVGVLFLLFGFFYHVANRVLSRAGRQLLPVSSDFKDAIAHYVATSAAGKNPPKEGKFLSSQKLAYLAWGVVLLGLMVTGGLKVAAHAWSLPASLMGATTLVHDVAALAAGVMFVVHVVFGAVLPASWPLLRSLFGGYVTEEYVREHHAAWYEELKDGSVEEEPTTRTQEVSADLAGATK